MKNGHFTAHMCIDCALIKRDGEIFQTCKTEDGARLLADLLNRAAALAGDKGSLISTTIPAGEIIAHAIAKTFDWRLELPGDRERRLISDDAYSERREGKSKTANPHEQGSKKFQIWDGAWLFEDDMIARGIRRIAAKESAS